MIDKFKAIIQQFRDLLVSKPSASSVASAPALVREISLEEPSENYLNENYTMLETPDLLSSIEKIISDDFCVLKASDTVSDALALVILQKASDIIIVDNEDKFAGIIRYISVISEVPPQVSDVPLKHRIKISQIRQQVNSSIVNTVKRSIGDVFELKKYNRKFSKDGYLIYALEELAKPYRTYLEPQIIPILDRDETIVGIVSYRSTLEYIKNHRFWVEAKVEELFSAKIPRKEVCKLLPEDTLAKAFFVMEYLPIDYILICDRSNNLLGMVERNQVSAFTHPLYYHLMDMTLGEIMKPVESLYLVESSLPLNQVVGKFLELGIEVAIAVDRAATQVRPLRIITPLNLLNLFLQNFRSTRK